MERIDEISLKDVLPLVFGQEGKPHSDVWCSDLTLHRGESYLVEATSGAGKSSLCSYIYGLRTDYTGTISFNGKDISALRIVDWQELRRRHLAYLPQDLELFADLTAMENILLKNDLTGFATESEIDGWMRDLGVDSRRDFPVGRMSVGQRQRVAMIRALCQPFDFILLDEPVSHLDSANNALAAAIVADCAHRREAGIITTSVGNHLQLENPVKIKL